MSRKNVAVGIALVAVSIIGVCHAKLKDGCKLERLRACGDDYLPFGKRSRIATSGEPFVKQCRTYKEQILCSRNFVNDCLDDVFKDAAILALDSYKESIDEICTTGSRLYKGTCQAKLKDGCKLETLVACGEDYFPFRKGTHLATSGEPFVKQCASYGGLLDCAEPALTPCEKVGGKEFMINLVDKVLGEVLAPLCKNYKRGSQSCKALPTLPALGPHDRKFRSFIELIIEVVRKGIPKN
ncbi:hypothetical protein MTO96_025293 [Rhipicephalus appendiculatus]